MSHPQDFSADVRNPVLFQGAALRVFHQVRHRSGATKLHHQLDINKHKKLSTMKEQNCSQKTANRVHWWTHPKLVIVTWWTLLDKGTVVCGYVAMVAVFLQHVDFCFNLLFLLLRHVHHFDGGQLARLHVTALV